VKLEITTDANCIDIHGVQIAVGVLGDDLERAPPSATTTHCVNGRIGRLVLVPSGKDSAEPIGVRVIAGFGAGHTVESCAPPYGKGCIVARRAIRYVKHAALTLPISLDAACDGIPCEASYTCKAGMCVPAMPPQCGTPGCDVAVPQWTDCGDTTGLEKAAPWPMTDGCPTHNRRSPYAVASAPKLRWRLPQTFNKPLTSLPAVSANGSIVFGTETGDLDAYEAKTGVLRKAIPLAPMMELFGNSALGSDGALSITGGIGIYSALTDLSSGIRWSHALVLGSDVAIGVGPITYTLAIEQQGMQQRTMLIGFDAAGIMAKTVDLGPATFIHHGISIGPDGTVYAPVGDGKLYAIDPTGFGSVKWAVPVGACDPNPPRPCTLPIVAMKDRLYALTYQTISPANIQLLALDPNGNPVWQASGASETCLPIVGLDGTVHAVFGTQLRAFDPGTGAMKWSFDFGGPPLNCAMDGTGAILAIVNGRLVALDTATRAKRWDVDAYKGDMLVLGGDGTVYLRTTDNSLVALGY
jgi:outer membrane protein assembly factor BamB